jgi:hypothetical protein
VAGPDQKPIQYPTGKKGRRNFQEVTQAASGEM